MAITWSVAEGRSPKAEKGSECQQASVWLPGECLIQKAGAEWAVGGCAKLSQAGVHEKDAGFIRFLIKKKNLVSSPNHGFWLSLSLQAWEPTSQKLAGLVQSEG